MFFLVGIELLMIFQAQNIALGTTLLSQKCLHREDLRPWLEKKVDRCRLMGKVEVVIFKREIKVVKMIFIYLKVILNYYVWFQN